MKPLIFFDIEATGLDLVKDRIVVLAASKYDDVLDPFCYPAKREWRFNPGIKMSDEVIAIHGITNEMVSNYPELNGNHAAEINSWFSGCDLAGFNVSNFDAPMLWEDLYRNHVINPLADSKIIDVGTIFKIKEERTLAAAVKFYCGREHTEAHDANADNEATSDVFLRQLERYPELMPMNREDLSKFSLRGENRFDLCGKIIIDKDGDPAYAFGKVKGLKVKQDIGFAQWMLRNDFPKSTLIPLMEYLSTL